MEAYAGRQFVGIDLHRRRTVIVRTTEGGEVLETVRIVNDVERLASVMARAGECPEVVLEATYGWHHRPATHRPPNTSRRWPPAPPPDTPRPWAITDANRSTSLTIRTVSRTSPPSVVRTITDRRRCRSIPTNCLPAYASIVGLLALARGT